MVLEMLTTGYYTMQALLDHSSLRSYWLVMLQSDMLLATSIGCHQSVAGLENLLTSTLNAAYT
jgi:hypothetical protein